MSDIEYDINGVGKFDLDKVFAGYDAGKRVSDVLGEVYAERAKQDAKWGQQNHPMVLPINNESADERAGHNGYANDYKKLNDMRATAGADAWDTILLEEVHEAFAESNPDRVRAEMIQVAAVAVAIIECIDRAAA